MSDVAETGVESGMALWGSVGCEGEGWQGSRRRRAVKMSNFRTLLGATSNVPLPLACTALPTSNIVMAAWYSVLIFMHLIRLLDTEPFS